MNDLKAKIKTRGVSALLEDRETMFTEQEMMSACKAAIFEAVKCGDVTAGKVEEIATNAIRLTKKGNPIIPRM